MKDTINEELPKLDKLIVDVIHGQSEFRSDGTDLDSVVVAIQSNWPEGTPPHRDVIFNMTSTLLEKMLVKRLDNGNFVATDLDELAVKYGIADFINKL